MSLTTVRTITGRSVLNVPLINKNRNNPKKDVIFKCGALMVSYLSPDPKTEYSFSPTNYSCVYC